MASLVLSTAKADLLMKKLRSQIFAHSSMLTGSLSALKFHRTLIMKKGSKGSKISDLIFADMRFNVVLMLLKTVRLFFIDLFFDLYVRDIQNVLHLNETKMHF